MDSLNLMSLALFIAVGIAIAALAWFLHAKSRPQRRYRVSIRVYTEEGTKTFERLLPVSFVDRLVSKIVDEPAPGYAGAGASS